MPSADQTFRKFARRSPEWLDRGSFRPLNALEPLIPYPVQRWPTFLEAVSAQRLARLSVELTQLLKVSIRSVFDEGQVNPRPYYGRDWSEFARAISASPNVLAPACIRCTLAATGAGFQMLSVHCEDMARLWYQPMLAETIKSIDVLRSSLTRLRIQDLQHRDPVRGILLRIVEQAISRSHSSGEDLGLAIVVPPIVRDIFEPAVELYLNHELHEVVSRLGRTDPGTPRLAICLLSELVSGTSGLHHSGHRIHAVIPYQLSTMDGEGLGGVNPNLLADSLAAHHLADPRHLALLWELADEHRLTPKQKALVRDHIPWARRVSTRRSRYRSEEIHLPEFISAHQHKLVLRRASVEPGSQTVIHIGRWTEERVWQETLATALADGCWVVQEEVATRPVLYQSGDYGCYPHHVVWCTLVLGESFGGASVKLLPQARQEAIRLGRGAHIGVVLEEAKVDP